MIAEDLYEKVHSYIKTNICMLNNHEYMFCKKNPQNRDLALHSIFQLRFPINYCFQGDGYIILYNNRFKNTINLYEKCHKDNPVIFRTGNCTDIINTLFLESHYPRNFYDYLQYLQTESLCYVIQYNEKSFGKILRIDLFRQISKDNMTFVGGLFHCMSHFSIEGNNLCMRNDHYDIQNIEKIIEYLAKGFSNFYSEGTQCALDIDDRHIIKMVFFKEEISGIFFVKTSHIEKKQNRN